MVRWLESHVHRSSNIRESDRTAWKTEFLQDFPRSLAWCFTTHIAICNYRSMSFAFQLLSTERPGNFRVFAAGQPAADAVYRNIFVSVYDSPPIPPTFYLPRITINNSVCCPSDESCFEFYVLCRTVVRARQVVGSDLRCAVTRQTFVIRFAYDIRLSTVRSVDTIWPTKTKTTKRSKRRSLTSRWWSSTRRPERSLTVSRNRHLPISPALKDYPVPNTCWITISLWLWTIAGVFLRPPVVDDVAFTVRTLRHGLRVRHIT